MMREGIAPTIRRQDYAAPAFWIRRVELTFDLDPAKTIVASKLHVERNASAAVQPLRLHGEDITVLRVMCAGESLSFRQDDNQLVIDNPPAADSFVLEIRNTCAPERNTELSGLYTSGGGLFTQCEAEGFRRITYFLDRPDVMAIYTVTLRGDKTKYPVLLSNGNLVEQGELDGGPPLRHLARPLPQAELPVCAGRRRPGVPRTAHHTRAPAGTTCCRSTCARATSARPNTQCSRWWPRWSGTKRASAWRWTSNAS